MLIFRGTKIEFGWRFEDIAAVSGRPISPCDNDRWSPYKSSWKSKVCLSAVQCMSTAPHRLVNFVIVLISIVPITSIVRIVTATTIGQVVLMKHCVSVVATPVSKEMVLEV